MGWVGWILELRLGHGSLGRLEKKIHDQARQLQIDQSTATGTTLQVRNLETFSNSTVTQRHGSH